MANLTSGGTKTFNFDSLPLKVSNLKNFTAQYTEHLNHIAEVIKHDFYDARINCENKTIRETDYREILRQLGKYIQGTPTPHKTIPSQEILAEIKKYGVHY